MNEPIDYQIIEENGEPRFAVVPFDQFKALLKDVGATGATVPHEVVSAIVDGVSPVKAWREYKRMGQVEASEAIGVSQATYSGYEASGAFDSMRKLTKKKIADGFGIEVEQLDI
ncbi:MAG: helix-turn-helix transcriptional regulator [Gammaproteobacteria bacterium]|nr:helix-turn-helix transcriptional regulator [Gammaproteobacteria bacterium]